MKQEDIDYITKTRPAGQLVSFCLCPAANSFIENTVAPVLLLLENKAHIVIGTDSLASNHQLDILSEMKIISKRFPGVKTEVLLNWATFNGARALQMEDRLGSFERGKKPGIVLIENIEGNKFTDRSKAKRIL